jgi:hypothetical protein
VPGCREHLARLATELSVAALFGWVAYSYGASWRALVLATYVVLFTLVAGIDLQERRILNKVLGPAAGFPRSACRAPSWAA